MHIVIKTLGEVQNERVSIEIGQSEAADILDQAERAGKVPALEHQVQQLRSELGQSRDWTEGLEARVRELEAERDALLLKVEGYDNDRHTEKQRADENRAWAERTEDNLEIRTHERDESREKLTRIQDKVWKDTLDFAMNHRGDPASIPVETVGDLANAVSAVRSIVGQP